MVTVVLRRSSSAALVSVSTAKFQEVFCKLLFSLGISGFTLSSLRTGNLGRLQYAGRWSNDKTVRYYTSVSHPEPYPTLLVRCDALGVTYLFIVEDLSPLSRDRMGGWVTQMRTDGWCGLSMAPSAAFQSNSDLFLVRMAADFNMQQSSGMLAVKR